MKKIIIGLVLFNIVLAQNLGFPSINLPPVIDCGENFFACLGFFFNKILRIIIVLALVLAAIFIAWAGILYISKGSPGEKGKEIHQKIIYAVIGLVVALLSYAFVMAIETWLTKQQIYLPINFTYAQVTEPELPKKIAGCNIPSVLESTNVSGAAWKDCFLYYLQRILSLLYVLAIFLGVIFLSWAGILYITKPEKSKDIHKRLIYGIIGIVIAILSFTIVKMIDLFFTKLQ
ncbi:MAG: hypothetical protein KatS3mg096_044 [Candidatus Parcubacteria bacterium]|nr:MAG: hypothetical protein KatS3mg096_044 [Candidatus Parcubacteria bacterium]